MELGMVGLGRMGANMVERLVRGGHQVVGFDPDAAAVARVTSAGAGGADSLVNLAGKLGKRKAIWIMVPSGAPVDQTIAALIPHLSKNDILIDGGNSNYKDSQRRGISLKEQGFQFVDVGTSGGIWGLKEGYSMMVGGDQSAVDYL
ncbi:MAG TPA: NAD(P)-binding domain-containing protein, partial [Candidatus Acidoferrales bacterium]|nr:NAD(P)-binding domain-containing protein [Candidatus Acidoferrales bacterium]